MLHLEKTVLSLGSFTLAADLRIYRGESVAIIGPSGAGKSSLLALVAGFLKPSRGRVLWDEHDVTALPPGARAVSILFQEHNLFPHLSVSQNIGLGRSPKLKLTAQDRRDVLGVMDRVGLQGLGDRRPAQLSGGQRSRVALARVLLRREPLLLLDEPFAALGPGLRKEMLGLVREVAAETGATVLIVTHDPQEAQGFAARTIFVDCGTAEGPFETKALFATPPEGLLTYLDGTDRSFR